MGMCESFALSALRRGNHFLSTISCEDDAEAESQSYEDRAAFRNVHRCVCVRLCLYTMLYVCHMTFAVMQLSALTCDIGEANTIEQIAKSQRLMLNKLGITFRR